MACRLDGNMSIVVAGGGLHREFINPTPKPLELHIPHYSDTCVLAFEQCLDYSEYDAHCCHLHWGEHHLVHQE